MTPQAAIQARRHERALLIDRARRWVDASREGGARIRQAWVFGSVARGDHHDGSDIDVLVVATDLPDHPIERLRTLAPLPGRVEAVVWSPVEFAAARGRGDQIAVDVVAVGVDVCVHPACPIER